VPVKANRLTKISKMMDGKEERERMPKGTLVNLRDQLRKLNLRNGNENNKYMNATGHFSLISKAQKNDIKPGIFGFKLILSDVDQKVDRGRMTMKGATGQKFFNSRKRQQLVDPEQQFHENMVAYKDSLPPFFKSSKFVLINKEGELLQEETDALRAQLSPTKEDYPETEVPFSQNDEESYFGGHTQNDRLIQLIPKKFKENLVYKYKEKHTDKRMKSVRALPQEKIPASEMKTEMDQEMIEKFKKTGNFELLSPSIYNKAGNHQISNVSEYDSRIEPGDKSTHVKALTSAYQYAKEDSDYDHESIPGSDMQNRAPFDMVKLQNEAFSKMFVETQLENPTSKNNRYYNENESFKKSIYPRSKIPVELKRKFDMISDNFNYNDEFWKPENLNKEIENQPRNANTSKFDNRGFDNTVNNSKMLSDRRAQTSELEKEHPLCDKMGYMKADWIDKIIKIRETLDKK
jgi:hypothetical protein